MTTKIKHGDDHSTSCWFVDSLWNSSRALALRDGSTSNMIQEDKDDQNTVPSSISNAGPLAQDIREEDRKFVSLSTRGRVLDYDFIAWFT
jgi:hypothetical protein